MIVDTTVAEKNIAFPTDAKLCHRARERLIKLAKGHGIKLRQSCKRVEKNALIMQQRYLRANWLSNTVFEDYNAIVEAGCEAWNHLIDQPDTITSIGMRKWVHIG